jgi:hypothetical protein
VLAQSNFQKEHRAQQGNPEWGYALPHIHNSPNDPRGLYQSSPATSSLAWKQKKGTPHLSRKKGYKGPEWHGFA